MDLFMAVTRAFNGPAEAASDRFQAKWVYFDRRANRRRVPTMCLFPIVRVLWHESL